MNMISTGAFQTEMDASIKQETLAEAFVRVWEKKNSKVARAGGVSLMALTLAACGSDDDTATTSAVTDTGSTTTTPVDTDGDGVADADDAFPNDATETVDTDGDGIGDNADSFPNDSTNTPAGQALTLATTADILETANAHDTFTATNTTLLTGDVIDDASETDTDILNLTSAAAPASAATIANVEIINVVSTSLTAITAFDADNTTNATINVSIDRFGNDGGVTIANVEGNAVNAGNEVDTLTLTDVGTTTINAGSADLVIDTDTLAAGQTVTVDAGADLSIGLTTDNAGGDTMVVNGAVTVDLVGSTVGATDTITAADATLDSAELATAATVTAAGAIIDTTTINMAEWTIPSITIDVAGGMNVDGVQNDQTFTIGIAQTAVNEIDGEAGQTGTVTLDTAFDLDDVTISVFTNNVINVSDDVTTGTITAVDTISLTGTGDVTVGDTATATTLDASGLTGDLTLTANTGALVDILGGSGAATYTTGDATNTFQGQGGADDVTVGALDGTAAAATFVGAMGGGADTLTLQAAADTTNAITVIADMGDGADTVEYADYDGALTLEGGNGSDTLLVVTADDLSAATVTATGMEVLAVQDAATGAVVNQAVTVDNDQIESFSSVAILAPLIGASDDDLTVTVTAEEATVSLAGLTIDADVVDFAINGTNGTTTTIVGSAGVDVIDAGTSATSVTGGAGDDTFTINATDSTEASMMAITDYQGAAAAADNDTLSISASVTAGTDTDGVLQVVDDVTALDALDGAGADASGTTAANDINIVVTDGIITLSGTAANTGKIDTLAEWIDIAELAAADSQGQTYNAGNADGVFVNVVGFEFGGNTYLVSSTDTEATTTVATEAVIELTGITGMTIGTAAAADTILIA